MFDTTTQSSPSIIQPAAHPALLCPRRHWAQSGGESQPAPPRCAPAGQPCCAVMLQHGLPHLSSAALRQLNATAPTHPHAPPHSTQLNPQHTHMHKHSCSPPVWQVAAAQPRGRGAAVCALPDRRGGCPRRQHARRAVQWLPPGECLEPGWWPACMHSTDLGCAQAALLGAFVGSVQGCCAVLRGILTLAEASTTDGSEQPALSAAAMAASQCAFVRVVASKPRRLIPPPSAHPHPPGMQIAGFIFGKNTAVGGQGVEKVSGTKRVMAFWGVLTREKEEPACLSPAASLARVAARARGGVSS